MRCPRCRGFMVEGHLLDLEGQFREMWATSWRCVNCGHLYDCVIKQHRQETIISSSSAEPDYQDDEVHLGAESYIKKVA